MSRKSCWNGRRKERWNLLHFISSFIAQFILGSELMIIFMTSLENHCILKSHLQCHIESFNKYSWGHLWRQTVHFFWQQCLKYMLHLNCMMVRLLEMPHLTCTFSKLFHLSGLSSSLVFSLKSSQTTSVHIWFISSLNSQWIIYYIVDMPSLIVYFFQIW